MIWRKSNRGKHAYRYCRGFGLEIGALHQRFDLKATVLYLDWMGQEDLKSYYAGDPRAARIKPVHLIASRPPYEFLDDAIFDFVLSSHVLEHMPNPGLALEEWYRLISPGGVVYGIIPNKTECFDRSRRTTPVEVLMEAYDRRDPVAPLEQYRDFHLNREIADDATRKTEAEIQRAFEVQDSIHVYTYEPASATAYFEAMAERLGGSLDFFHVDGVDIHFMLRKPPRSATKTALPLRHRLRAAYRRIRGLNPVH